MVHQPQTMIQKGGPVFLPLSKGGTRKNDDSPSQIDDPLLVKNDNSLIARQIFLNHSLGLVHQPQTMLDIVNAPGNNLTMLTKICG